MKPWHYVLIAVLGGLAAIIFWVLNPQPTATPAVDNANTLQNASPSDAQSAPSNTNDEPAATKSFSTADLPNRDPAFDFSASIPPEWAVEYVAGSQAVNLYDPNAAGEGNLQKSKIFIKYFRASSFLTLQTVDIKSRTETTINGRPAVTYVIEKKAGVADFPSQPSWRNTEHRVTDIRSTDASPTVFYVFAKAPDVSDELFDTFLASVMFGSAKQTSDVVYPMRSFLTRITKKGFGQFISPATSPVQPERFTGYHTGVDAERLADDGQDIPVLAVADGKIVVARSADGYGGVMLIEHVVKEVTVTALYGHVRLSSVRKAVGQSVEKAEQIALLGTGETVETDGQRQHLHFGLLKGRSTTILGYVSKKEDELSAWENPLDWLAAHHAVDPSA